MLEVDERLTLVSSTSHVSPADVAPGFEAFFEAERPKLLRALLILTRNTHEAEEVMQEAFVKVWERWDKVHAMEDPSGYLYRTAMNVHRSAVRRVVRAARRAVVPDRSEDRDPFRSVEARDEALRVLARLTPRQRAAVAMTELLGFGVDDAARAMGIKAGTVRVLVSQARRSLTSNRGSGDE